mmetsp:Transcript_101448/g.262249  ORF Transcript_101448/g.262249 Transcript_101448/m.262249 type:complete len:241 (+) Transcript_101448:163-885(+)
MLRAHGEVLVDTGVADDVAPHERVADHGVALLLLLPHPGLPHRIHSLLAPLRCRDARAFGRAGEGTGRGHAEPVLGESSRSRRFSNLCHVLLRRHLLRHRIRLLRLISLHWRRSAERHLRRLGPTRAEQQDEQQQQHDRSDAAQRELPLDLHALHIEVSPGLAVHELDRTAPDSHQQRLAGDGRALLPRIVESVAGSLARVLQVIVGRLPVNGRAFAPRGHLVDVPVVVIVVALLRVHPI